MLNKRHVTGRRKFLAGAVLGVGGTALLDNGLLSGVAGAAETGTAAPAAAVITPADQQYPDLIRALNARFVASPARVCVVDAPAQIAPLVNAAVSNGKRLTVRSGGHCYEDFVYDNDTDVIIDLTNMNRIYYDQARNAIAIESGATLLDVYEKLYQTWGVVIPGGVCYSVGVGGHVAGGGWGWLVRRNGLVVDHLYAVEVVTVNSAGRAQTIVATREPNDPHRDLWWAHTGGGGGNFGIVTRYFFRSPNTTGTDPRNLLPKPPASALFATAGWNLNNLTEQQFGRLVTNYGQWHIDNRTATGPNRDVTSALQASHKSSGSVVVLGQLDASLPNAAKVMTDYVAYISNGVATPDFSVQTTLPWLQFVKLTGTTNSVANDPTERAKYKAAFMKGTFTAAQTAAMYKHLTRSDISNPNIGVIFQPYGGKVAAVAQADTAIQHRDAAYQVQWSSAWTNPADDAANIGWTRDVYSEVYATTGGVPVPNDASDGSYVNHCDADLSDPAFNKSSSPWSTLYYKGAYPRLQAVKKKYDPRNVFRHRQSVELPS
jgi:FAD/FMN-containing dehydrogenase